MSNVYSSDFIKSFENLINQQRFEELEDAYRKNEKILEYYQDFTSQFRKFLLKLPSTTDSQKILSQLNSLENLVHRTKTSKTSLEKMKKSEVNNNQEIPTKKARKIIIPTKQELEKIAKSTSMPLIRSPVKPTSPKMADRMQIVSEFTGQFKHMSRYSSGCTILEKLLDHAPDDVVTLVFDELKDSLPELILHPNGQHILPKIAEFGSEETKDELFEVFSLDLVRYCCHQFGGYASQKVAPFMKSRHIKQWTPTLKKNMSTLATDPHGNYVVQLLLKIFNADETSFFFDGLVNSASSVAQTKIGCSVLTHAMDLTTKEQLNKIIPNLMVNCSELIQDQYGNFVIQRLMDNYPDILTDVISCITGNVVYYSKQKFSSNVVEKCLKSGSKAQVSVLLNELYESESISVLIEDQYGNFVIQASLDCVPENEKESVASKILPHIPKNGKFSYHIEKKLLQTLSE